ncbi:hypothetical protein BGZ70_010198 [Mortierella alpina]|uniref:Uncharacterized protein n=1 Tax=Mortierella alpina TaxID=64518 RepID=A0A9P6M6P7_MORAP|nr:hypothetical protein BGZ70_010198 [Mortierella alpina]
MHLDGTTQDALKAYLTKELALISDADPAMLADYIIALLKHDKETHELKSLCNLQLDDFLMKETEPFVTKLFDALESKSYLQNQGGADSPLKPYNDDEEELIPTGPAAERNPSRAHQSDLQDSRGHREKHRRGDSDVSEDEDRSYKHARRETDRDNTSEHRRHADRRGDRSGGPVRPQGITTSGFNSRNNMNSNQGFNNNMNNNGMDRGQWNGPPQQRSNFQDQHNNGSWRGAANMRGGRGGMQGGPGFGQERRRQRCRDYDEKGFCMRGDDCPYDHGEDRIVVDDMQRVPFEMMGGLPGMGHNGMAMGSNRPPFFPGGPNGGMMSTPTEAYDPEAAARPRDDMGARTGGESFDARRQQGGFESGRFQDGSGRGGMRGRGSLRGMRGGRGRGGSAHPYATPGRFGAGGGGAGGSKTSLVVEHIPDEFNTIDKVNDFFKQFGSLTNIQVDQAAHKALIQYSSREEASNAYNSPEVIFGNRFVKVYWQPEDVDASTFGRQPKPTGQVRPEMGAGSGPGGVHRPHHSHAHGHAHTAPHTPATSVLMTPERAAELAAERAAAAAKMEENKKTMQEIQQKKDELIKRQQEEQRKIMEKLFANKTMSQEDKDEILKGLKNVAIEVTKEMADPMAQARAAATAAEAHRQAEMRKEAERLEKAKLDLELEGLNSTDPDKAATGVSAPASSGSSDAAETTAALKAKLAALQAQATALGLESQGGYAGRGRGGFMPRGRGRGAPTNTWTRGGGRGGAIVSQHRTFRIDNRTSKLSVSNVDEASKDGLKTHFEAFGELESFSLGPDGTSATVQYKNRKDAESAMQQGSQVANAPAPLKLGWISEPQAPVVPGLVSPPSSAFTKSFTTSPHAASAVTTTAAAAAPAASSAAAATAYHHESEDDDEDGERSWKR